MQAVPARKADQRDSDSAPHRQHLEQFSHLGLGHKPVRSGAARGRVVFAEPIDQPAIEQEVRLRRVAEDVESGRMRRLGHRAEVDMGGKVVEPRPPEGVGVRTVTVLAAGPGGTDIFLLAPDTGATPGMKVK